MANRGDKFAGSPCSDSRVPCSLARYSLFRPQGIAAQVFATSSGIRVEGQQIAKIPCRQGIYCNGPKAGGGMRRFEAAS